MARTSKSPRAVLLAALATAERALPAYSHRYSPKKFTQQQLFACLVLKSFLKGMEKVSGTFFSITQKWQKYSDGTLFDQVDYTYDDADNRLTRDSDGTNVYDQEYAYDGLHRLTSQKTGELSSGAIINPTGAENFTYDQLGNWATYGKDGDGDLIYTGANDRLQTRAHDDANQLGTIDEFNNPDWATVVHDAAGNMTEIPQSAAPTQKYILNYDAWNRLIEVRGPGGALIRSYEYDGLGQRIRKDIPGGTTDDRDYYYNDQWQLLTEVKDGNVEAIYHWHPFYIDALGVRMRSDDIHYFLHDANFNVTAAVDDSTSAVVERYAYTPYGEVTFLDDGFDEISVSAIDNQHLCAGPPILSAVEGLQKRLV